MLPTDIYAESKLGSWLFRIGAVFHLFAGAPEEEGAE